MNRHSHFMQKEKAADQVLRARMEAEVARFLAKGEADPLGSVFPGNHALERLVGYEQYLRKALIYEVRLREKGRRLNHVPPGFNPSVWTQRKVQPMITGLFPAAERQILIEMAARAIVFRRAVSWLLCSATSAATTLAPSRANASAVTRPMPLAAPVTNATLF